jgi:TetR/AcrR family transcriptional repressor of nem operon
MARPRTYERGAVLRKATELFSRKGYEGAHLQELVEVTGLNRFSLYKEFGGKEGLFQAALDSYLEQLEGLGVHLKREPAGLSNVYAFYTALLEEEFPHGCLAVNTIREKQILPRRIYKTIEAFVASTEASFLRNLEAARDRGELPGDTDAEALARFLTALNLGLMSYGIVAPGTRGRPGLLAILRRVLR